jgi:hypothetical protein
VRAQPERFTIGIEQTNRLPSRDKPVARKVARASESKDTVGRFGRVCASSKLVAVHPGLVRVFTVTIKSSVLKDEAYNYGLV